MWFRRTGPPAAATCWMSPGQKQSAISMAFRALFMKCNRLGILYPDADVPVFEVSLDHARGFREPVALGKRMRHLRERGVLLLGSGNLVHNLRNINRKMPHAAYPWAEEFDHKVKKAIAEHDVESLSAPDRSGSFAACRSAPDPRALCADSLLPRQHGRARQGQLSIGGDGVRRDLDAHGALRERGYLKRGGTARNGGASHCQVAISQAGE